MSLTKYPVHTFTNDGCIFSIQISDTCGHKHFYLLRLKSLDTACISCSQSCHCPLNCHNKANCHTVQATWSCAWIVPKRLRCFEYLSVGGKHSQVGSQGGTEDEKNPQAQVVAKRASGQRKTAKKCHITIVSPPIAAHIGLSE